MKSSIDLRRVAGGCAVVAALTQLQACATADMIHAARHSPSMLTSDRVIFEKASQDAPGGGFMVYARWAGDTGTKGEPAPAESAPAATFGVAMSAVPSYHRWDDYRRWVHCAGTADRSRTLPQELQPLVLNESQPAVPARGADLPWQRYPGPWQDWLGCTVQPDMANVAPQGVAAVVDGDGNLVLVRAPSGIGGPWDVAGIPNRVMHRGWRWRVVNYALVPAAVPFTLVFDLVTFPFRVASVMLDACCDAPKPSGDAVGRTMRP